MLPTRRLVRALVLSAILLSVSSTGRVQSQSLQCNPPWGFCYNYCVREYSGLTYCMDVSFDYFCAPISGGCYSTANCDSCGY
jgi:hypothetical protein